MVGSGEEVLVVGVGNTCGIGNSVEEVKGLRFPKPRVEEEEISRLDRILKKLATPPKPPPEKKKRKPAKKTETQKVS
jgi:hypothetical protein